MICYRQTTATRNLEVVIFKRFSGVERKMSNQTLSATGTLAGSVNATQNDWYSFVVTGTQEVVVDLINESGATLSGSSLISSLYHGGGGILAAAVPLSSTPNTAADYSVLLNPGTYYADVSGSKASYLLDISAGLPTLGSVTTDVAGHVSGSPYNLGTITSSGTTVTGGVSNNNDFYSFTVGTASGVQITLVAGGGDGAGITAGLENSSGKFLVDFNAGSGGMDADPFDNFSQIGSAVDTLSAGTYTIELDGDANYSLAVSATPTSSISTPTIVDHAGNTQQTADPLGTITSTGSSATSTETTSASGVVGSSLTISSDFVSAGSLDSLLGLTAPIEDFTGLYIQSLTTTGTLDAGTLQLATATGVTTGTLYATGGTFQVVSVDDMDNTISVAFDDNGSSDGATVFYVLGYSADALALSSTAPVITTENLVLPHATPGVTANGPGLIVLSSSQLPEGTGLSFSTTGTTDSLSGTSFTGAQSSSGASGSTTTAGGSASTTTSGGLGSSTTSSGSGSGTSPTGSGGFGSASTGGGTPTVDAGSAGGAFTVPAGVSEYVTSEGSDTIYATSGAPTISASTGNPLLFAGNSSLNFVGGSGAATVIGGSGGNTATGGSGNLLLFAVGTGTYTPGTGAATIIGGAGGLTAVLGAGGGEVFGGTGGVNTLAVAPGSAGNAALVGIGTGDVLSDAGAGSDILVAGAGAETLGASGSTGALDAFFGGSGARAGGNRHLRPVESAT